MTARTGRWSKNSTVSLRYFGNQTNNPTGDRSLYKTVHSYPYRVVKIEYLLSLF